MERARASEAAALGGLLALLWALLCPSYTLSEPLTFLALNRAYTESSLDC